MAEDATEDKMETPLVSTNHGESTDKPTNHTDHLELPTEATNREEKNKETKSSGNKQQNASSASNPDLAVDVCRSGEQRRNDQLVKEEGLAGDRQEAEREEDDKVDVDGAERTLDREAEDAADEAEERKRGSRIDSSDSETDSDEEGLDTKRESEPEISSDVENELIGRKLPTPRSRALHNVRAREFGHFQKCTQPFRHRFMGCIPFVQRLEKYCELKHHEGCVNTLHFNPAGDLLASGSDDLEIVLWDWAQQKPRLIFESGHRSNVFQAKFMPCSGDATLVSCARDGQVRVAELSTTGVCKETKKIVQHKGAAHKLGLEPHSPVVFMSCGEDAAVFNIDLREPKPTKLMLVKEEDKKVALYTIFVNPANVNEFIVGGRDHFVRVFDKRKISDDSNSGVVKKFCPQQLVSQDQLKANVTCCVYSYNGQEILASYNDEDIYLFDSAHSDGADFIRCYKGHRNNATVKGVNFYGPRSEYIITGSDCGNIFLWEKESEKIVHYMQGDVGGVVNCLEPHPSVACLATSGLDHDVKVWLPTAKEPTDLAGLKKVMMTNRREREEERLRGSEFEDNAMLRFLMAHLRHRARRQARESGELDSDSDSDSSDSDDLPTAQCATS